MQRKVNLTQFGTMQIFCWDSFPVCTCMHKQHHCLPTCIHASSLQDYKKGTIRLLQKDRYVRTLHALEYCQVCMYESCFKP